MASRNLKIKVLPYEKLKRENFSGIFEKMGHDTIILVDAKLSPEEESRLIERTMSSISDKFSGIEMASIDFSEESNNLERIRDFLVEKMTGRKKGFTVIGPAKVIREIKKDPEELLLYM